MYYPWFSEGIIIKREKDIERGHEKNYWGNLQGVVEVFEKRGSPTISTLDVEMHALNEDH